LAAVHHRGMDYTTYQIIHLVGLAAVALGTGGMMAGGNNRKLFAIWQGVGLIVVLVAGFGMLAKGKLGFPHFAIVKLILWVVVGMMPLILRKLKTPLTVNILISLALVGILAWLGVMKPALW
jgi:hypothetical protein